MTVEQVSSQKKFVFRHKSMLLGNGLRILGILNITPDSFSDGKLFFSTEDAVKHALFMFDSGASIVDVGGESTRPGAEPVSEEEEISRVVPVICEIRKLRPEAVISVDTSKSAVALKALEAGADIINDVSGLRDPQMPAVVAKFNAGLIIMHMRGSPRDMQSHTEYSNLIGEISAFLLAAAQKAMDNGVKRNAIIIDPGIGFAKTTEQNLEIMRHISVFAGLGFPVLVGPSRKSFIGAILNKKDPKERIFGTAGAIAWLATQKVDFVRVHDVKEMDELIKVFNACEKGTGA